jgi:hypothetical protein
VPSIARPGGNITGVSVDGGVELYGKRLGLLVEAVPKVSNVHYLASQPHWERPSGAAAREAARLAGISLTGVLLGTTFNETAYQRAFNSIEQDQVDALMVSDEPEHIAYRIALVELAAKSRIPAIYSYREFVEVGGLMAYSIDLADMYRRVRQPNCGDSERHQTGRNSLLPTDPFRSCDQPQDCQGARPRNPGDSPRPRRQSDRVGSDFRLRHNAKGRDVRHIAALGG